MEALRDLVTAILILVFSLCMIALPFLLIYFFLWIITTFWITILVLVLIGVVFSWAADRW